MIFTVQSLWGLGSSSYIFSEQLKTLSYALSQVQAAGIARRGVGRRHHGADDAGALNRVRRFPVQYYRDDVHVGHEGLRCGCEVLERRPCAACAAGVELDGVLSGSRLYGDRRERQATPTMKRETT